jgi:hypothetical protein
MAAGALQMRADGDALANVEIRRQLFKEGKVARL